MTNLPITASTAQTAAPGKQSANANDSADASTQPFGEVLARQIGTPAVKVAKRDDKLAVELAAQTVAETGDIRKDDKTAAEVAGAAPTDMLAALLPQVMNLSVAAPAAAKTDTSTIALPDSLGIATAKTGTAAAIRTDVTTKAAPLAAADPKIGERSFAATLGESAARTATNMETVAVAREASAAASVAATVSAAAQQPNTAAMASIQNAVAGIAAPAMQAAQLTVNTPVNQPRWGDEFSQKITWLASSKMDQSAELHLNPPQLGPLDVVLKVSGDQATALFTSPHAAVREAIEQALPRLRDMLADNGITLGNATVSDQAPREQARSDAQRASGSTANDLNDSTAGTGNVAQVSPISRHNGIVDTFA
jgi:flagellar hook-length control protein FliK